MRNYYVFTCVIGAIIALIVLVTRLLSGLNDSIQFALLLLIAFFYLICAAYSSRYTNQYKPVVALTVIVTAFGLLPYFWFTYGRSASGVLSIAFTIGVLASAFLEGMLSLALPTLIAGLYTIFILADDFSYTKQKVFEGRYTIAILFFLCLMLSTVIVSSFSRERRDNGKAQLILALRQRTAELEVIAKTDPLTGIYNRRYLSEQIHHAINDSTITGDIFTLAMIDIDYFKRINDNFGHLSGDRVLVKLTRVIGESLGENDIFGRYGGEEFLIIFQRQPREIALYNMEKVNLVLAHTDWGIDADITISTGIAEYDGCTYSQLLERVDQNLYRAKDSGRNCIV